MPPPGAVDATRDHGFHTLRVARVVTETPDAVSLVLDVPDELRATYEYAAGQFCTFRVVVDGATLLRCYSMSSAPGIDDALAVTVKRVPDGRVSNWINDNLSDGGEIEVTPPAGVFCLGDEPADLLLFAAGSGITPIFSILKTALAAGDRRIRLLYANRDRESTIFRAELDALAVAHGDRFVVIDHLDVDAGFVDAAVVARTLADDSTDCPAYVCGPTPFMDIVEDALLAAGVAPDLIHIERFTPAADLDESSAALADAPADGIELTIELDGRTETTAHRAGTTILQTARQLGMDPPYSCESGSCATCMGRLREGTVTMHTNDALTDEEVEEGWILTCQSVPTAPVVSVVYGYD
ncbi:MAG: ferredoxin--NADP reductase [Actinobacteria bacterium]|nr:ferredoxin--NADP reductase [Actinomycetota bacterium]